MGNPRSVLGDNHQLCATLRQCGWSEGGGGGVTLGDGDYLVNYLLKPEMVGSSETVDKS